MAKQIIALEQNSNGTEMTYRVAFWYAITSGVRPQPSGSAWSGASAAENTAIQAGSMLEEIQAFAFPVGAPIAAIKAVLQQAWADRNAQIGGIGPNSVFGVSYDPASGGWSA